jgi:hypothetical protein
LLKNEITLFLINNFEGTRFLPTASLAASYHLLAISFLASVSALSFASSLSSKIFSSNAFAT